MKKTKGFTLIEIMMVIAIIGILSAIAVPAYGNYMLNARRSKVEQELSKLVNVMENCYSLNQTYIGCLSADANNSLDAALSTDIKKYYTSNTSNTSITKNDYILSVSAIGSQVSDSDCKIISVNRNGIKSSGDSLITDTNKCWN